MSTKKSVRETEKQEAISKLREWLKRVNVNIGRGRNAGPMTRVEIAELAAAGWKFKGGRNGDTSGWDGDGGYALSARWL